MFSILTSILYILLSFKLNLSPAALFYPSNSAYGIFAAIAVPLDLPNRNVFVSYNFEANYDLPENWALPPYATNLADEDLFNDETRDCLNCSLAGSITHKLENRDVPSLLTRTNFYYILADKFQRSGFEGINCLLRLICEINSTTDMKKSNGVLGNLLHIMFSPSTSRREGIPLKYYKAEWHGVNNQCHLYETGCKDSILDLITISIQDVLDNLTKEKLFA